MERVRQQGQATLLSTLRLCTHFWCILMPPPSFRRTRLEIAGRGSGGARTSTPATLAAVSSPFFKGVAEGRRLPSPMRLGSRPPRRALGEMNRQFLDRSAEMRYCFSEMKDILDPRLWLAGDRSRSRRKRLSES
jgi:hypothetical protein